MPALAVADTHVHLYPGYALPALFRGAFRRLSALAPPAATVTHRFLLLTERQDCHFLRELREGLRSLAAEHLVITRGEDEESLRIQGPDGLDLWLVAGRQIISQERIEVLALTRDLVLPDGLPVRDVIRRIRDADALPVLSWAPGKWFFGRGELVRQIIEESGPRDFLIGDTSLRPTLWPTPRLMQTARRKGIRVIAGSDPLPFAGEEEVAGRYGIRIESAVDPARPASSLRALLRDPAARITLAGRRDGVVSVLQRLKKNHAAKRSPS